MADIFYQEALNFFLDSAVQISSTETVPTLYAAGRVLARSVTSTIDVPAWDNSQMDGYAVRADEIAAASAENPVRLPVSARIPAGSVGGPLEAGTCARIFTGAPVPAGADTVVQQEDVAAEEGFAVFTAPVAKGTFVRRRAGDVAAGSTVAKAGDLLSPALVGLIASVGRDYVEIYRKLRVAVFFTGDELVAPGQPLPPGGIYNSNRYTMRALLRSLDCEIMDLGTVPDTRAATIEAFSRAAEGAEVIITVGGMSVGEEDHIKPAVEALGHVDFWRLAIKPGKPVALGRVANSVFIGLPGNPVSCFVTFLMLARPLLRRIQGCTDVRPKPLRVRADFSWPKAGKREEFVRVRRNDAGGLDLFRTQNSQILTSCVWADGVVDVPARTTVAPGDTVSYYPFGGLVR